MDVDDYTMRQISARLFEYDVAIPDRFIEEWLHQNFEEGVDFNIKETGTSLHVCTVQIEFLKEEVAVAFKLRWAY